MAKKETGRIDAAGITTTIETEIGSAKNKTTEILAHVEELRRSQDVAIKESKAKQVEANKIAVETSKVEKQARINELKVQDMISEKMHMAELAKLQNLEDEWRANADELKSQAVDSSTQIDALQKEQERLVEELKQNKEQIKNIGKEEEKSIREEARVVQEIKTITYEQERLIEKRDFVKLQFGEQLKVVKEELDKIIVESK